MASLCTCCHEENQELTEIFDISCQTLQTEPHVPFECLRLCASCIVGKSVPLSLESGWRMGKVLTSSIGDKALVQYPDGSLDLVTLSQTPYSDYLDYHRGKNNLNEKNEESNELFSKLDEINFANELEVFPGCKMPPTSPISRKRPSLNQQTGFQSFLETNWDMGGTISSSSLSPLSPGDSPFKEFSIPKLDRLTAPITPPLIKLSYSKQSQPRSPSGDFLSGKDDFQLSFEHEQKQEDRPILVLPTPARSTPRRKRKSFARKALPTPWTIEEDNFLTKLVHDRPHPTKWTEIAHHMGGRSGKQCRERYLNHLAPKRSVEEWSAQEDALLCNLYFSLGSKWALMARIIKGRTDNNIKNRFHHIRRRLDKDLTRLGKLRLNDKEYTLFQSEWLRSACNRKSTNNDFIGRILQIAPSLPFDVIMEPSENQKHGPFQLVHDAICSRCNLFIPSHQTGRYISQKHGWCESCTKIPPYVVGDILRHSLKLQGETKMP